MPGVSAIRSVRQVLPAPPRHWVGNGFQVIPVFHDKAFTAEVSPWLMFDYAAPKVFEPTTARRGVGQHPHRGFETVTIAFQGEVEHGDSVGNSDVIGRHFRLFGSREEFGAHTNVFLLQARATSSG